MKPVFKFSRKVFDSKISRLFFAANFIICPAVLYWGKSFGYFDELSEVGCKPKPRPAVSFGLYDLRDSLNFFDEVSTIIFWVVLAGLFLIFFVPSTVVCGMISAVLNSTHPALCGERISTSLPIFMIVNGIYWILLGYFIESSYLKAIQNKPARKNPLSIYSG